jgi:ephrin-B
VVGVVTIPRNLPALLVLEYCEHGTLWEYVRSEPVDELDSLKLMSFCLDVCSGMHYLSSRRIVHRDVAARNVLVDAAIVCKVIDRTAVFSHAWLPCRGLPSNRAAVGMTS